MIDANIYPKAGKRYKHVTAVADGYHVVCPYKGCEYLISIDYAVKGYIVKCPNCRKELKITRIT